MTKTDKLLVRIGTARDAISRKTEQTSLDYMIDGVLMNCSVLLKEQEHEVCENCPYNLEDIGDFSDGYHTFNDLYYQRCVLFATIVNMNKSKAWKTRYHEDGEPCFGGGWFLVTVETPEGAYGYHYEDKYWNMFDCEELPKAKRWDGYTDKDVGRLLTLK